MVDHDSSSNDPILLYALQTCPQCRKAKEYLQDLNVRFKTVYVDMLVGEERNDVMRRLRRMNPDVSFPTMVIGETVVVGFKKEALDSALKQQR